MSSFWDQLKGRYFPGHALLMVGHAAHRGLPGLSSSFKASAPILFANISLDRASHVPKPTINTPFLIGITSKDKVCISLLKGRKLKVNNLTYHTLIIPVFSQATHSVGILGEMGSTLGLREGI